MSTKTKGIIIALAALLVAGSVAAVSFRGGVTNMASLRATNMEIVPVATPESGTLIEALDEAGFVIDEAGNVEIPNMMRFGDPPAGPIATTGDQVAWAEGTVRVKAGGEWIDSHPVEGPTGAACAIVNPFDEPRQSGTQSVASGSNGTVVNSGWYLWPGTATCEVISPIAGRAVTCELSQASPTGIRIKTFKEDGSASNLTRSVNWSAELTRLPLSQYTCGIMRNPAEAEADILAWKMASLDSPRLPDDQFFVFVKDENGDWFAANRLCELNSCIPFNQGLDVAWFVWRVEAGE